MSCFLQPRRASILHAVHLSRIYLYPALCTVRAASLNSAIGRGLRKEKGVGFRNDRPRNPGEKFGSRGGSENRGRGGREGFGSSGGIERGGLDGGQDLGSRNNTTRAIAESTGRSQLYDRRNKNSGDAPRSGISTTERMRIRRGKKVINDRDPSGGRKLSRAARFYDPESSHGNNSIVQRIKPAGRPKTGRRSVVAYSRRDNRGFDEQRPSASARSSEPKTRYPSLSDPEENKRYEFEGRQTPREAARERDFASSRTSRDREPKFQDEYSKPGQSYPGAGKWKPGYRSNRDLKDNNLLESTPNRHEPRFHNRDLRTEDGLSRLQSENDSYTADSSTPLPITRSFDKKIPLSIPYTTSASEFLYGSSVVEAGLRSRKVPRRQLYKLYIYAGENREKANSEQDRQIEYLAKKTGVQIVRVSGDKIRLMDKMSGGRPHNGYILEASPLPRLPVISLGELTTKDADKGFEVVLDYQSEEDAAINGTSSFIPLLSTNRGRKPLVLLLDSIVDPGNLGGIIRSASFLGVTAVAISTRNSASFSPIVFKASAGSSESVTLFSVKSPAGFIVDSKEAGWKVYAAVAPSGKKNQVLKFTDDLKDPLLEHPCILMLGGEGDGLRWNLRVKADVELAIMGQSSTVDSLNVSVAAGILCDAFFRRSTQNKMSPTQETPAEVAEGLVVDNDDLPLTAPENEVDILGLFDHL
jgi:21S rRNA (GM2251-2'-O)-methyltransferase